MKRILHNNISGLEDLTHAIKTKLIAFYNNNTFSLDDRWEVFVRAPNYTKAHYKYIYRFKTLEQDDVGYDSDFYYTERYQTIDIVDIANRFIEVDLGQAPANWDASDEGYRFYNEELKAKYDAFREEVLSLNLGSFIFDW